MYLAAKKDQTDKARPNEIEAFFEYDKIEEDGLLTAYNDILPYRPAQTSTISRNEPCPCGSGKKYKKCCPNNAGIVV
ncbi:MAG: SEC-C domain-containing protein [Deltaproteobacteria bacterium]|nr:SEC-C domain-containing protein [Deltaproteobacteria bacterium]